MKSESKYYPLTMLLRHEFGSVTKAAQLLEVSRVTLWRWMRESPERFMELILHSPSDTFTVQLVAELNHLIQLHKRERGGQC
jgi:hypothetical protein